MKKLSKRQRIQYNLGQLAVWRDMHNVSANLIQSLMQELEKDGVKITIKTSMDRDTDNNAKG